MKNPQQELPFRQWGGARKGAGRKRESARPNVPHRVRQKFRNGTLHVTVRIRDEVWNLRSHRCFRALRRALEKGCSRFGFRLVHFSVQGNHMHFIVEAPDGGTRPRDEGPGGADGARPQQGDAPAWARVRGPISRPPAQVAARTAHAVQYVLDNWRVHALRDRRPTPSGVDPWCSTAWAGCFPPLVAEAQWWMLRVGVERIKERARAA